MHLLERYALTAGLKINEQEIMCDYFPLPCSKYITIHNQKKFESRRYEYFDEVISLIEETLKKEGYNIVHVGTPDEPNINGSNIIDVRGKTSLNQMAYIIQNSSLHIGVDSLPSHMAGMFNVPYVGLYPNMYAKQSMPYFGDKSIQVFIESNRKGNKPSYAANENPKTINTIMPETIAQHAFDLLGIKETIKVESLFFGQMFKSPRLTIIPSNVTGQDVIKAGNIATLRADLNSDPISIITTMNHHNCEFIVMAKSRFDIELLKTIKHRVRALAIEIDDKSEESNLIELKEMFKQTSFFTKDEKNLKSYQVKFFDLFVSLYDEHKAKEKTLILNGSNLKAISSSLVINEGVKYPSVYHALNKIEVNQVFDVDKNIYEDIDNMYIFKINQK